MFEPFKPWEQRRRRYHETKLGASLSPHWDDRSASGAMSKLAESMWLTHSAPAKATEPLRGNGPMPGVATFDVARRSRLSGREKADSPVRF